MKTKYLFKFKKDAPKGADHPIYVALYEGDVQEIIYTGQRCKVSDWSKPNKLPKDERSALFREIDRVMNQVNKAKIRLEADDKEITPFSVKQAYEALRKQKEVKQVSTDKIAKAGLKTVYSLAKQYKENLPDRFRAATNRTLKISVDQFMQYLDIAGLRSLEIKDMTDQIIDDYAKYLLHKRKLANSTYNKRMKHLNWFFRFINYKATIVPRKQKKKPIIALTVPELRALEAIDVTTHKSKESHKFLQRAKDMFLLGCYTGLRISDLKRINPRNSDGGFIRLTTQKNNELFEMPIVSQAREILERYDGYAPKISEQEVNRSIKTVCELAKIDKLIDWPEDKGGVEMIKTYKKFEMISSHIAGKTFITNAKELWGLDEGEVAAIVRKDLKTMLNHYFKPPVERATLKMLSADKASMKVLHG